MEDNQIRIPPADGIRPATDELFQLYSCLENYETCSYEPLRGIPPVFLDKYETAVEASSGQMIPFPMADDSRLYPVSTSNPALLSTGRQIAGQSTSTLFDITVETLQHSCPEGIKQLLPQLHDALYWAERAGLSDAEIQEKLDEVRTALKPCLVLPPEPPPFVVSPKQAVPEQAVPEPPPAVVEVPPVSDKTPFPLRFFLKGSGSYYLDPFHSVDLTLAGGLRFFPDSQKPFFVQAGGGANLWQSLTDLDRDEADQDNELSSIAPQVLTGVGYAFPYKKMEVAFNTGWSVVQERRTTYDLADAEGGPVTEVTSKPDVDLMVQGSFHGMFLFLGYRVGHSFHTGIGYELVFGPKSQKQGED